MSGCGQGGLQQGSRNASLRSRLESQAQTREDVGVVYKAEGAASQCKGPAVGEGLLSWRNLIWASVAGIQWRAVRQAIMQANRVQSRQSLVKVVKFCFKCNKEF